LILPSARFGFTHKSLSGTYLEEKVKRRPEPQINCFYITKMGDGSLPKNVSDGTLPEGDEGMDKPSLKFFEFLLSKMPGNAAGTGISKSLVGLNSQDFYQHKTKVRRKAVLEKKLDE
jgi:hypothetical protein